MRRIELYLILIVIGGYGFALSIINLASGLRIFELTSSKALLSLAVLAYNLLYALMSLTWFKLFSGRLSRASLSFMSLAIIGISSIFMGITCNSYIIILLNAILGLSAAIIMPVMTTIITDYIGKDAVAITYSNTSSSIGMALGYLVAAYVINTASLTTLLILVGVMSLFLSLITFSFPPQFKVIEGRRVALVSLVPLITGRLRAIPSILAQPNIISGIRFLIYDLSKTIHKRLQRKIPLLMLGTILLFTSISIFFTPMPAFLKEFGLSDSEIYLLSLISIVTSTLMYRVIKRLVEVIESAWRVLLISVVSRVVLFSMPLLTLLKMNPKVIFYTLYFLIGISWAGISTALTVLTLSLSERERRGERLGHLNTSISVGLILGSLVSSAVADVYGIQATSIIAALLALLATYTYYKAMKSIIT